MTGIKSFSPKQLTVLNWWCENSPYQEKDALICDGAVRSGKTLCMSLSFVFWGIAWDEIKTMQPIELLFGKGTGYELYLYDKQDYQALNEAYPDLEKSAGWMHPHSFILSDLLSGGLLKCAVSLFLLIASIVAVFRIMRLSPNKALYFLPLGLSFINCAMSGKFGLLYDKTFWFFIVLLMAFLAVLKRERAADKTEIS